MRPFSLCYAMLMCLCWSCRRQQTLVATAFSIPPPSTCVSLRQSLSSFTFSHGDPRGIFRRRHHGRPSVLFMNAMNTNGDPFEILGIQATSDKKEIKRAYKRMALKFHPDVVVSQNSSKEERRKANDVFARINWAYQQLSGKNGGESSSSTGSSTATGTGSYTPPHRRKAASGSYSGSTDWRDYMPKYDEADYDAGGDSFGAIFSDLFSGATDVGVAGAAAGGGIFRDFVEFLERNVDGGVYTSDDNAELRILLSTGTLEQVGMEMDDTQLVVEQLEAKRNNVRDELIMCKADASVATRFAEKMEMQERVAELEARQRVVDDYLKMSRKRLLELQMRYKELIVQGGNDERAGGRSRGSSWGSSSSGSGSSSAYSGSSFSNAPSSEPSGRRDGASTSSGEEDWKHQGFGSSGRGRGSSRRARTTGSRSTAASQASRERSSSSSYSAPPPPPRQSPQPSSQSSSSPYSSTSKPPEPWTPPVPPHRRTSTDRQVREEKARLRELQVDEEFDKLKKDLGL